MEKKISLLILVFVIAFVCDSGKAQCPLAHTHIGVNPTWRPDWSDPGNPALATDPNPTDDNQLWFSSLPPVHPKAPTPGWPNWEQADGSVFLRLVSETDIEGNPIAKGNGSGKILWTCRFMYSKANGYGDIEGTQHLDGWHSAHGPQGKWNLESVDQSTTPAWEINLQRESATVPEDDFFMLLPNDQSVLVSDGSTFQLPKVWLGDFNAWGFHQHMGFCFWLPDELGQEVSVEFSAFDAGDIYTLSDNFEFRFVTVPEPATISLLIFGVAGLLGRHRGQYG